MRTTSPHGPNLKGLQQHLLKSFLVSLALMLACAEVGLFFVVRRAWNARIETSLRKEVEKLASQAELEPDEAEVYDERIDSLRLERTVSWWQMLSEVGTVLGASRAMSDGLRLPPVGGSALRAEQLIIEEVDSADFGPIMVGRLRTLKSRVAKPGRRVTMPESMIFDIRAAVSLQAEKAGERDLLLLLGGVYPLFLGAAGLAANRLLRRSLRPVELAFEREQRFTGSASHELRTPLTALLGEVELSLRRERSAQDYRDSLERMRPTIQTMVKTVQGLLTIARLEAGSLLLGSGGLSAGELETALRRSIEQLPLAAQVSWLMAVDSDERMHGDLVLLVQAVRNLVDNALTHGGTQVELSLRREKNTLTIDVADNGPGFDPQFIAAHKPDSVASSGRSTNARFGLAVTHAIALAHGGRLELHNQTGSGAHARIVIPTSATRTLN